MKYSSPAAALSMLLAATIGAPPAAAGDPAANDPGRASALWIAVGSAKTTQRASYDGVVEAVRQTTLSVQVAGAIVELAVKAGDSVKAGQVLMRVDARSAAQGSAASEAQANAAQAQVDVARKEFDRQQQLFNQGYVSQAAIDRAQGQLKAGEAQLAAHQSMAAAARTQAGFFVLKAPYAGVISEVPVALGDLALPGKPLATLYDPSALRVRAAVPQSALPGLRVPAGVQAEIPGLANGGQPFTPQASRVMPEINAATHTAELRLDLPSPHPGVTPGMFARAWIPGGSDLGTSSGTRIFVPTTAVVQRAELSAVYAEDVEGHAVLRQVRLGPVDGDRIEILAGIGSGDRVLANPRAVQIDRVGRQ